MIDKLLEKFEDTFKSISDEEAHQRLEDMSDEELSEFILENYVRNLRVHEFNSFFYSLGGFEDEKVNEVMDEWLEEYMGNLNRDELFEFMDDAKAYKNQGRRR